MRVFLTGATGLIGTAIVRELLGAGHQVVGLARSAASAQKLAALGARAHPGSLEDLESIRLGAEGADAAIHAAFFHALGHMGLGTRLRVLLGGAPSQIGLRFARAGIRSNQAVIDTLGEVLSRGRDRALLVPFGTLAMKSGVLATEDDPPDPQAIGAMRSAAEGTLDVLAARGVRAISIRLPPIVHGPHDGGFAPMLYRSAVKKRASAYVGDGMNRWPSVHVSDAARLFRLALEKGAPGARYHGIAEEGIPFRHIAGVFARRAGLPTVSVTAEQAPKQFGFLSLFVGIDNPASSAHTQQRLGWQPTGPGLLQDLEGPEYFAA